MAWRTTVALLSCLLVPAASSAVPVAEQVNSGNASTRLFGGTDADGGIGDWYISNGIVEAIIDDVGPQADLVGLVGPLAPPKASEAAFTGGSLIDIGTNGANNDQLAQMFTVGGLSTSNFILYDSIGATAGSTSATISASGTLLGFDSGATPVPPANLPSVTQYTVNDGDPYLTINTTVTNTHPTNPASGLGGIIDAFIWVQRGIVPFSPAPNRGFTHSDLDFNNILASVELIPYSAGPGNVSPADGIMDPANGTSAGEVSYGLLGDTLSIDQDGPGGSAPTVTTVNTMVGVSSSLITAFGNFPSGSLQPGGILSYTRRIYVGTRNDVASVTNPMITALAARQAYSTGTISGNVDASDTANVAASIIATRVAGGAIPGLPLNSPISQVRTDATGAFSGVVLPVGTYNIEIRSPERDTVNVSGVVVAAAANTPVTIPPLTGLGSLDVSIFERGIPGPGPNPLIPAKLVFKGIAPTPDPAFRRDFDAFALPSVGPPRDIHVESFAGGPAQGNFAYLATGTGTLQLRPGRYEVYAARGPEYTVNKRKIRIKEGITKKLKLRLKRVVDTTDYISGDFHIHSGRSLDSSAPLRDRVASFAGEGVEVMVSTDHDYHVNYAPIIASLGIGNLVTSIIGNEVTTSTPNPPAFPDAIGHINAWPMIVQANERRDGSIEDEFVAPNFLYSRLRDQGAQVVQYNHVRAGVSGLTSIGFFNNFGYDPDLPITSPPNDLLLDDDVLGPGISGVSNPDGFRNLDFDVLEIGNGTDIPSYLATRRRPPRTAIPATPHRGRGAWFERRRRHLLGHRPDRRHPCVHQRDADLGHPARPRGGRASRRRHHAPALHRRDLAGGSRPRREDSHRQPRGGAAQPVRCTTVGRDPLQHASVDVPRARPAVTLRRAQRTLPVTALGRRLLRLRTRRPGLHRPDGRRHADALRHRAHDPDHRGCGRCRHRPRGQLAARRRDGDRRRAPGLARRGPGNHVAGGRGSGRGAGGLNGR